MLASKYIRDGDAVTVYCYSEQPSCLSRLRGGVIAFYKWGSLGQNYTGDPIPAT